MWADLVAWFQSAEGARVLQTAVVPAVAILVAALLAAWIGRGVVRAAIRQGDRDRSAAAIAGLVAAARLADDDAPEQRRRASRIRGEADVRMRLLPLRGADQAADWASARIDGGAHDPASVDELRDRLVAWARRPGKAKRLFADVGDAARPMRRRSGDASATTGPTAVAPPEQPRAAAVDAALAVAAAPVAPAPVSAAEAPVGARDAGEEQTVLPAWQRTRSGERLQQERTPRQDGIAAEEPEPTPTAPVQLQHAHRAPGAPAADTDEAVRQDAHQVARHARAGDGAAPSTDPAQPAASAAEDPPVAAQDADARFPRPAVAAAPIDAGAAEAAAEPDARPASPAWLDDYDDEAQVTRQNLDLRTPPPVSASAVRDRGPRGEDLVPRS